MLWHIQVCAAILVCGRPTYRCDDQVPTNLHSETVNQLILSLPDKIFIQYEGWFTFYIFN